jgi:hypothetical protein
LSWVAAPCNNWNSQLLNVVVVVVVGGEGLHRILHSIECGVLDFWAASFVDFLGLRTKVDSNTRTTTPATGGLQGFSIHECSPTR